MGGPMSRWFRWYEGTSEDGKFRVVARLSRVTVRDVIALWAFMLEDAAHLDHRGVCKRNEDFMASILDFEDGTVERILEAMESVDMISVGAGAITLCNWAKRQFEGDTDPTANDRQRRKRERDKTVSHDDVTRDSRPPETEAETNTEKKDIRSVAKATRPSADFEKFKEAYPKRGGANPWQPARKLFEQAIKSGHDPRQIISGAANYATECDGHKITGTEKVAQAQTWLRQARFADYAPERKTTYTLEPYSDSWKEERARREACGKSNSLMDAQAEKGRGWSVPFKEAAE